MAIDSLGSPTVSSAISQVAASLLSRDRIPIQSLQDRQKQLNTRSSVLSTLKTRMLALRSQLETVGGVGTLSPFAANTVTSSDASVLTAAATANAAVGTLAIQVNQLARRATHASNRYDDSGTVLSGGGTGTFSFDVTIGATTATATVTIGSGDSDKTVLDSVVAAITSAIGSKGSAVRLAPESGKSRLSLSAADTGTANKITFADTDGLLARLGIVNGSPTAATDTTGGYIYDDLGNHELDAKLTVDGLTYYRASNTVSDLVTGVTFTLKGTSTSALTVKIQPDADRAVAAVKDFIAKYNDVLDYLTQQTATDPKGSSRGILAGDPVFGALAGQLRTKVAGRVASQASGTPDSLAALGLIADKTGKLSIKDETTLRDTFLANPKAVASLFNAADGLAPLLKTFIDGYTRVSGQISLSQSLITTRVNGLQSQIDRLNETLARKQRALEEQLARSQAQLTRLNQQATQIANAIAAVQP